MKRSVLILAMTASGVIASAQTPAKPSAPAAAARPAVNGTSSAIKLAPGIPPVRGIVKTAFSLRYEDIKIGTGKEAEPGKLYKVLYTGYRAADGVKFDSSEDHRRPVLDKDNKPVNGPDGKPELGPAEPMQFPQGMGRIIPGFDQGFAGMKVGGKRRIFIPWQLAYGTRDMPARGADHPGIPPKSDLIFDVELVDVADFQMPMRPGMPGMPPGRPMPPGAARPGTPGGAPTPGPVTVPGGTAAPPAGQPTAPPQSSAPSAAPPAGQPAAPAATPQPNAAPTKPETQPQTN